MEVLKVIGTHDQPKTVLGIGFGEFEEGIGGVIGFGEFKFNVRDPKSKVVAYGPFQKFQPLVIGQQTGSGFEGILRGNDKPKGMNWGLVHQEVRHSHMANVNGVKGAKIKSNVFGLAHRFERLRNSPSTT